MELSCITLPFNRCVHLSGSSLKPLLLGFYGDFLSQAWSVSNSISSPFPLSRETGWGWGWKFQVLIMAWSFWWPASIDKSSWSPFRVTSVGQMMLLMFLSLRNSKEIQGLCDLCASKTGWRGGGRPRGWMVGLGVGRAGREIGMKAYVIISCAINTGLLYVTYAFLFYLLPEYRRNH